MDQEQSSLIIRGGQVLDGAGAAPFTADVLLRAGRVAAVAPGLETGPEIRVFQAGGRMVCPGFIDTHAHDELYLLTHPRGGFKILQGVTTVIGGNCGVSPAPVADENLAGALEQLSLLGGEDLPEGQRAFPDYGLLAAALDRAGLGLNFAGLIGHGMLRLAVMGSSDRPPSPDQAARMKDLLVRCLDQGALGLSLGLIYAPGAHAGLDELVDLARVVRSREGIVAAHIRNEGARVVESVEEMIGLARLSGAAVHISHHKTADPGNRGKSLLTLELIDQARSEGLALSADAYPYRAGSTYLAAVLPVRAMVHGPEKLKTLLRDKSFREDLRQQIESDPLDRWHSLLTGQGEYRLTVALSRTRPHYVGRSVAGLAQEEGRSPYDLVFDLIAEEGMGATMIIHSMAEEDVRRILRHPAVMIGSDGIPPSGGSRPHPRLSGTFPRILGRYVREQGLLDLPEAVRKMTSLPARTFNLRHKGILAPGMDADLVVFNPETVCDCSTYDDPEAAPRGVDLVVTGGRPAVIEGRITGQGLGRVIRRGGD